MDRLKFITRSCLCSAIFAQTLTCVLSQALLWNVEFMCVLLYTFSRKTATTTTKLFKLKAPLFRKWILGMSSFSTETLREPCCCHCSKIPRLHCTSSSFVQHRCTLPKMRAQQETCQCGEQVHCSFKAEMWYPTSCTALKAAKKNKQRLWVIS